MGSGKFKRILVAVDGSKNSARAAKVAITLAKKFNSQLIICNAIQVPFYSFAQTGLIVPADTIRDYLAAARDDAKKMLGKLVRLAEANHVNAESVVRENTRSVVEAVVTIAESKHVDLIVIGSRGLSGFKKLLIGSVSSGVINHAHCPVLVVR